LKFIADSMLGKLSRWLRMLGHDVEYSSKAINDKQLIETAKAEQRILLTRDLELYKQAMTHGTEAFFVEGATGAEKLASLAKQFNFKLEVDVNVSRCPKCNTQIRPVAKDAVTERVPEGTLANYYEFWECTGCGHVYWQGTHWKRINKTLKDAKHAIET
jgi:uncharacterized protein with PIN domain